MVAAQPTLRRALKLNPLTTKDDKELSNSLDALNLATPKKAPLKVRFEEEQLKAKEEEDEKRLRASKNPWAAALLAKKCSTNDSRDAIYDEDSNQTTASSISSDDGEIVLTPDSGDGHISPEAKPTAARRSTRSTINRPVPISSHTFIACPPAPSRHGSETHGSMAYNPPSEARGHLANFLRGVGGNTGRDNTEDRGDDDDRESRKRTASRRIKRAAKELACPYYKLYPNEEMIDKKCLTPKGEAHRVKDHLLQIHNPIWRCQKCKKLFGTEPELERHVQHETCQWKEKRHIFSITALPELHKRSSQALPAENIWNGIFKTILPHVSEDDIPTPYWEPPQGVLSFGDFRQRLNIPDSTNNNAAALYEMYLAGISAHALNTARRRAPIPTRTPTNPPVSYHSRGVHHQVPPQQTFITPQTFSSPPTQATAMNTGSNSTNGLPSAMIPWYMSQQPVQASAVPIQSSPFVPQQYLHPVYTERAQSVPPQHMYLSHNSQLHYPSQFMQSDRASSVLPPGQMASMFAPPPYPGNGSGFPQHHGSLAPERGPFDSAQ